MGINPEKEPEKIEEVVERKTPEKVVEELCLEKRESIESGEILTEEERIIRKKLEQEVEKMKLSPRLEQEAKVETRRIEELDEKGKLKKLLDVAEVKGLFFSISVARNMKDPYVLDVFHDVLIKSELYKKFME